MKKLKIGPYDEIQERVEQELGKLPRDKQNRALGTTAATAGGVFGISMVYLISPETPTQLVLGALGTLTSISTFGIVANANLNKDKEGNDDHQ